MFGSLRITDVVKNLVIINVLMFVAVSVPPLNNYWVDLVLWNPFSDGFQGLQLVTHMFMHANFQHIFFNMLMLVVLGPMLEARLGAKKFLLFYFISGFGSMTLHILANYFMLPFDAPYRMLGASGAIYGVMVGAALTDPNRRIMLIIPPIPVRLIYLVGALLTFDVFSGFNNTEGSTTAYFAHIGGAVTGYFLLEYVMPKIPE